MKRPPIEQQVTFLVSSDLARTAAFYEEILGLPLVLDQDVCRIYETGGNAYLGFCRQLSRQPQPWVEPNGIIVTLVTTAVDDWYAYLQTHNVPIEKPPTHNKTYNIYQMFVRDPDGYLIEIQTFFDAAWPGKRP